MPEEILKQTHLCIHLHISVYICIMYAFMESQWAQNWTKTKPQL